MNQTEHVRQLYEDVWSSIPSYGEFSPGERYLPMFLQMANTTMRTSVLDAGCGSGKGAVALSEAGFAVRMCDITDAGLVPEAKVFPFFQACLWDDLRLRGFSDWAYCCDVLEHVPKEFTMLVIARLLGVARRGVFLSIALTPDAFGAWAGKPLHQTVESFVWWRDRLASLGTVKEARDLLITGVYLVVPR